MATMMKIKNVVGVLIVILAVGSVDSAKNLAIPFLCMALGICLLLLGVDLEAEDLDELYFGDLTDEDFKELDAFEYDLRN